MKKGIRIGLFLLLLLAAAAGVVVLLSPYGKKEGFPYRLVLHTVEVDAPAEQVFSFLGNSANASRWSVFVHHIIPLNASAVPDGRPGSLRRCFKYPHEKDLQWDEEITVVEKDRRRQLTIFAMKDFPMQAEGLATEQLYEDLGGGRTRLTFTLFFREGVRPSLADQLKLYLAAFQVKEIYRKNMENVRQLVLNRPVVHPRSF